jgi:hypothetical protein
MKNGRTIEGDCILSVPDIVRKKRRRISVPSADDADDHAIRSSDLWANTSRTDILQAASNFCRKFPELSFLHSGTFDFDSGEKTSLLLKAALIALSCTSERQDEYGAYVKNGISGVLLEPPTLETVQTLLILAMLEWGYGRGYSAWMTTGKINLKFHTLEH